jgi:hypothetical protein
VKEMGFRALTLDMLAVNDLIEVKGKHIEDKKAQYNDFQYMEGRQSFERMYEFTNYFPHNNFSKII